MIILVSLPSLPPTPTPPPSPPHRLELLYNYNMLCASCKSWPQSNLKHYIVEGSDSWDKVSQDNVGTNRERQWIRFVPSSTEYPPLCH